jgi:hypothetical protein
MVNIHPLRTHPEGEESVPLDIEIGRPLARKDIDKEGPMGSSSPAKNLSWRLYTGADTCSRITSAPPRGGNSAMKKLAATLLMTGILAVAGFAAPANAAPKDQDSTTSSTSKTSTNHATIGWWPN